MEKYKTLLKNIGFLTIGNFASKFLSFLLVPLYTGVLTTSQYGTFDIISTTITLLLPILTLNIIEAVLRFPIDRQDDLNYISNVYKFGLEMTILGSGILFVVLLSNHILGLFQVVIDYELYIVLLFIVEAFNQLFLSFARATNHIKEISIAGVINSAIMLLLNLLFLLYFRWGLSGYFWATISATFITDLFYCCVLHLHKYTKLGKHNKTLSREMILYSFPMIFNTIGWWINNASDRYIVTWINGASANGIYSVSYKIPSILNVLHGIFMQAWILSAVQEYKEEGNSSFFKNVYNAYSGLLIIVCSILIALSKPIAYVLFQKDFYQAWRFAPFLLIAVIFGALSGVLGGIFSAEKDSKMFAISTCLGAVINIVLTIIMARPMGPLGAAIATAISSYIVWLFRLIQTNKYLKLNLRLVRDHSIYLLLIIQSILLLTIDSWFLFYAFCVIVFATILVLYRSELEVVRNRFRNR